MWEVGKKYKHNGYQPDGPVTRTCLLIFPNSIVLGPVNEPEKWDRDPTVVPPYAYKYWKEYKEPVVLKAWIPVLQHPSKEPLYISFGLGSVKSKEHVEDYIERNYPNHTILDIIEVTWQEKE